MKEKFTKPEINVLMNVIIHNQDDENDNNTFVVGEGGGDISGSMVPGEGGDIWD